MSPTFRADASGPPDFLPRSLRDADSVRYGLRDKHNRPVPPTLAGYRLRPNQEYSLVVECDGPADGSGLEVHPSSSCRLVHWAPPVPEAGARVRLPFETRGRASGVLQVLEPPTGDLHVTSKRGDEHRMESLRVPISVHRRWQYVILLIPAGLITWLTGRIFPFWLSIGIAVVGLAALAGTLALIDRVRMWRRASELRRTTIAIEGASARGNGA